MPKKRAWRDTHPDKSRKQRVDELDSDRIRDAVKECGTLTGLCKRLGFYFASGPFIKERMIREGIDFSHFWHQRTRSLEELLVKGVRARSVELKRRLLEAKMLNEICLICEQGPIYNNEKLVLQLDHIDGDKDNQELTNLRILCPNCHSQTATYCSKNVKLRRLAGHAKRPDVIREPKSKIKYAYTVTVRQKVVKPKQVKPTTSNPKVPVKPKAPKAKFIDTVKPRVVVKPKVQIKPKTPFKYTVARILSPKNAKPKNCIDCSAPINRKAERCDPCYRKASRKVERPSLETLLEEIEATSFKAAGRKYGVTDNTIRKWIRVYQKTA